MVFFPHQLIRPWLLPQIIIIDNYGNQPQPPRNKLQVGRLTHPTNQPLMDHQDLLQEFIIITIIIITAKLNLF